MFNKTLFFNYLILFLNTYFSIKYKQFPLQIIKQKDYIV